LDVCMIGKDKKIKRLVEKDLENYK
jgi:hypothetical protein